ncbi:Uncharacterised protein [Mycobacteroides abscessus subsp. abscessus]|nr:Uncharacterised protein [Mycobacteroides abscessus subsp. abscessus]
MDILTSQPATAQRVRSHIHESSWAAEICSGTDARGWQQRPQSLSRRQSGLSLDPVSDRQPTPMGGLQCRQFGIEDYRGAIPVGVDEEGIPRRGGEHCSDHRHNRRDAAACGHEDVNSCGVISMHSECSCGPQ